MTDKKEKQDFDYISYEQQAIERLQNGQWNRESAHRVLQVRTSVASNQWVIDWELAKERMYKTAA